MHSNLWNRNSHLIQSQSHLPAGPAGEMPQKLRPMDISIYTKALQKITEVKLEAAKTEI